ncbi:hypothetical protein PJ985_15685 [Streptomyces sp. ACA25]|uniref:hypothetical protein n=1 Tax=Streptomyces sp. ACA25 TaxID=3022596 RepID=UPI002306F8A6|nr:hypothetical protein [Streptomyces sp. ACA25]MDB1089002.1 hypothetical protein [Streptomyces sp. ACA25]
MSRTDGAGGVRMDTGEKPRVPPLPRTAPPAPRARPATESGAPRSDAAPPPAVPAPPTPALPPSPPPLSRLRMTVAVVCLVLGTGLLGGAAVGTWLAGGGTGRPAAESPYREGRELWRELPVDELFPSELTGEGTGPGSADRRWIRVAVAPDSDCENAFDARLYEILAPAGCHRLLRASYSDETETSVTTVGLLFTEAEQEDMRALRSRFTDGGLDERPDLLPLPYAAPGTVAAGFGPQQRATWTLRVLTDVPVVVYSVTGFADGRTVPEAEPAGPARADGRTSAVALSGLGHEAEALADLVERRLRGPAAGTEQGREEHRAQR